MTDADKQWITDLLSSCPKPPQTADESLSILNERSANLDLAAAFFKGLPPGDPAVVKRDRARAKRLRRLLADPELRMFLLDLEDRLIYGESVRELDRRIDTEKN